MSHDLQQNDLLTLDTLFRLGGRPIDPDTLAFQTHTNPRQLDQTIENLRRLGCKIDRDMRSVRLIDSGLGVWVDYLEYALTDGPKRTIEVYPKTASTQDLVKARPNTPLLILADEQTGGRGRLGRTWLAPPGTGLLFSMTHALSPDSPDTIDRISFLTAVSVAQAIEKITGHNLVQIRWPNDLIVDNRKLAGILVETVRATGHAYSAVIGVGINVGLTQDHLHALPPELQPLVTSFSLCGWQADRLHVAAEVISQIERNLNTSDIAPLIDQWRRRNLYREQAVRVSSNGQTITGTVIDLDPDDGLIIRRDTGEITHLPAATTTVL